MQRPGLGIADDGSEAAGERGIMQQKTLGTALSWKSVAMVRRMGEMSSHLSLAFFLFFFFFWMQLKAATQPVPPCAC